MGILISWILYLVTIPMELKLYIVKGARKQRLLTSIRKILKYSIAAKDDGITGLIKETWPGTIEK